MAKYSDDRFQFIERMWFGLNKAVATTTTDYGQAGLTFATKGATTIRHIPYWLPKGPITMKKAGYVVTTAIACASSGIRPVRILTRGASASAGCTITPACATQAIGTINSTTTFTVAQCKAGEYVVIMTASTQTEKGTEKLATTTGAISVWIDYVRTFDNTNDSEVA